MGFALSLLPLLVSGQIGFVNNLRLTINDQTDVSIGASSCGSTMAGNITTQISATTVCSALQMWVTDGECTDAPSTSNQDLVIPEIPQSTLLIQRNQNQTISFAVNNMPYFKKNAADGGGCGNSGVEVNHKLCASVTVANDISCFSKIVVKATTPVTISYDTLKPSPPSITSTEPFEGAAAVTVVATDTDTASIRLEYRTVGAMDFVTGPTLTNQSSTTIMGLTNGTTYEIRAIALDSAMPDPNASDPSEIRTVTPRESTGFWDACVDAGCRNGGCNAAAAGPLGLFALAVLMLFRRMRR